MTCEVSPLPPAVARPLSAIQRACFPDDPWDVGSLERILDLCGVFGFLAWEADAPAGFILARDLGDEVEILSLGVLPACRRNGLGRRLLDAVLTESGRRNRGSAVLEVAEGNIPARRLYGRRGFIEVGRRPRYYRHAGRVVDGLILRCRITKASPEQ